jgi:hypothetical protein
MERRKDDMVAALWANEGFNDDKGSRTNALEEIESNFQAVRDKIMGGYTDDEAEIDPDNPFFNPTMRAMKKLDESLGSDGTVEQRVAQESDYSKYIDQP